MYSKIIALGIEKKVAAEGIAPHKVASAIKAASEAAKTGGHYSAQYLSSHKILSAIELACIIASHQTYGGGYMYSGMVWTTKHGKLNQVRDLVKEKAQPLSKEEKGLNLEVLLSMPNGEEVEITCDINGPFREVWTKTPEGFKITSGWSHMDQIEEENSPFILFSGIRGVVARSIGLELSSTFHQVFDVCIEDLYNTFYNRNIHLTSA